MRELLDKLHLLENNKRYVPVKGSIIQQDIRKLIGNRKDIYIDSSANERTVNVVQVDPESGRVYQRYMVGVRSTPPLFRKIKKFLQTSPQQNFKSIDQIIPKPDTTSDGSTVGPSKTDTDGSQQGDNDSQSGSGVTKPKIGLSAPSSVHPPGNADTSKVPTLKPSSDVPSTKKPSDAGVPSQQNIIPDINLPNNQISGDKLQDLLQSDTQLGQRLQQEIDDLADAPVLPDLPEIKRIFQDELEIQAPTTGVPRAQQQALDNFLDKLQKTPPPQRPDFLDQYTSNQDTDSSTLGDQPKPNDNNILADPENSFADTDSDTDQSQDSSVDNSVEVLNDEQDKQEDVDNIATEYFETAETVAGLDTPEFLQGSSFAENIINYTKQDQGQIKMIFAFMRDHYDIIVMTSQVGINKQLFVRVYDELPYRGGKVIEKIPVETSRAAKRIIEKIILQDFARWYPDGYGVTKDEETGELFYNSKSLSNTDPIYEKLDELLPFKNLLKAGTTKYDQDIANKILRKFGKSENYEALRAIYGKETSYGRQGGNIGDSDRGGSHGGMQVSTNLVKTSPYVVNNDLDLNQALKTHPLLMRIGIDYYESLLPKVEKKLKKNKEYITNRKNKQNHTISWGNPLIDKTHFTSKKRQEGRKVINWRVNLLKKLYPDWGNYFENNKDSWEGKYDTNEKFAYKTQLEKKVIVPPNIDPKYVYTAVTYNGGPDEVLQQSGTIKPNPFTWDYANQYLQLLQKGISEDKEVDILKILIGTDKYRNTTKEFVVENSIKKLLQKIDAKQNKTLTEASMNVSMNGSSAAEVAELLAMIKNAGMPEPKSMSVMAPAGMSPGPIKPTGSCGCDSMGEETVEEEYANEPDETTMDTAYMTKDLAGGINRPKPKGALRAKDPAIHYDENIKETLKNSLREKYAKLIEEDPFDELDRAIASDDPEGDLQRLSKQMRKKFPKRDYSNFDAAFDELDRAIASDDPEGDLQRLSKQMRKKFPKRDYSNFDAAFDELGAQMDQLRDSEQIDPSAAMKQITGTPGGGKQHSQYDKNKNKPAIDAGTGQAPKADTSIKGALSKKYPNLTISQAEQFDKMFHNFQNNPAFQKNIRFFDTRDDKGDYIKDIKDKLLQKFIKNL